jgi:hypothetical protein
MASDGTGFEEHSTEMKYSGLAWSPAGDRFLVQGALGPADPWPSSIFLASLDGIELRQVTPGVAGTPDWSSSAQIAFTRISTSPSCAPRCSDIFLTRLAGTQRRLTYRGGTSPSWSPHGTKLAFVRADRGGEEVYIVRRDGRGLRQLTRRGGSNPSWAPDGKWIAFLRDGDIYVVRTTGRGRRRLVNAPALGYGGDYVTSLDWQPLPPASRARRSAERSRHAEHEPVEAFDPALVVEVSPRSRR